MDQEHQQNKHNKGHSEKTGLNNRRLRHSTRKRAYSEEYTNTVQPVNRQHLYPTATIQPHLANGKLPQQEKFLVKIQFLEQIRLKTLQLFVPNSKRLGGYTQ